MVGVQVELFGAGTASTQVFGTVGGVNQVSTGYAVSAPVRLAALPPPVVAGSSVTFNVTLPPDARIEKALFEVIAEPTESAIPTTVANLRAATPVGASAAAAASIDFGALVTVAGLIPKEQVVLSGGQPQLTFYSWSGTAWAKPAISSPFPELATERLLAETSTSGFTGDTLAQTIGEAYGIALPVAPTSLELQVAGTTTWAQRQGSAPSDVDNPVEAASGGSRFVVDATDALRTAFDASAADATSDVEIPVTLRAATPGTLKLNPQINALRTLRYAFQPEGPARTFDRPEEGTFTLDVSPPNAEAVYEIALTTKGSFGPERVKPPVGQPDLTEATLVLVVGRSILVGVPRALTAPFDKVSGLRMRFWSAGSGQVTGRLLAVDDDGMPAAPIKNGDVTPVVVGDADPAWYTLPFADAVTIPTPKSDPPPPDQATAEQTVAAWLELQAGYGEVVCGLTTDDSTALEPGGLLRRRASGRGVAALTLLPAPIGRPRVALRVVGVPKPAYAAVALQAGGTPDALSVTPTSDGLGVALTLSEPVPPPVVLVVTCAAAGSVTLDGIVVTYREQEQT
jgi:hypothetical protein